MGEKRTTFTAAEELAFTTEVGGRCPKCGDHLFFEKNGRKLKRYEIAHIYPLNPRPEELLELQGEERLSDDLNSPRNLIALCVKCHTEFDKLRTREEYREVVAAKRSLLQRAEQERIQMQYHLQEDIRHVIDRLDSMEEDVCEVLLSYDPKRVEEKLDETMPRATKNKIRHNVSDYFQIVQQHFAELERKSPNVSELVSVQVKAFYTQQKTLALTQHAIFQNVVEWFVVRTHPRTVEAAEIVASYFIQRCEVFE